MHRAATCDHERSSSLRSALSSNTSASNTTTASAVKGFYSGVSVDGLKRLHNVISAGLNTVSTYVNDLAKGWLILFIGGFVASVTTALLWLLILRYFAGVMARTRQPPISRRHITYSRVVPALLHATLSEIAPVLCAGVGDGRPREPAVYWRDALQRRQGRAHCQ